MIGTFEHVCLFADEQSAAADPAWGKYHTPDGGWDAARCVPNGLAPSSLRAWDTRSDTTTTDADGNTVTTHTMLPGFRLCVGLPAVDPDLMADPHCVLVADHDAREAGAPIETWCLHSAVPLADAPFYKIEP